MAMHLLLLVTHQTGLGGFSFAIAEILQHFFPLYDIICLIIVDRGG